MQVNRMHNLCIAFVCILLLSINSVNSQYASILENGKRISSGVSKSINDSKTALMNLITDPTIRKMCNFTTDEFIRFNGFQAETHNVTTEDGYILTIYRCFNDSFPQAHRKPVILQHGVQASSDAFVINPGIKSLAFYLANLGYDVWLPNSRGNFYSRKHVSKDPDDPESDFWNFSWDLMGMYDHPAVVDYILPLTGFSKVHFIGHSQGTSSWLVFLSQKPQYNAKVCVSSLMAPIVFFQYAGIDVKTVYTSTLLLWPLRNTEWLPRTFIQEEASLILCNGNDLASVCSHQQSSDQRNKTMEPVYACRSSGNSMNQNIHYGQGLFYNYFGDFIQNMTYPVPIATVPPPNYPLSNINSTITLHYSIADPATNPLDIAKIQLTMKIAYAHIVSDPNFTHSDFTDGMNAYRLVYDRIVAFWKLHECF